MLRLRSRGGLAARFLLWACIASCVGVEAAPSMAAGLPDGRAYELASPGADKDVMADTGRTRAASTEAPTLPMAAVFSSLGGFSDVRGAGVGVDYLTQRTGGPETSGWTVHAITPPQEPLSLFAAAQQVDPLYELFSPDLGRGVFRAWSPLGNDPNVADVSNLYARDDVRAAGAGTYQLLSDSVTPQPPQVNARGRPWMAGASGDLRHVLFESRLNLTNDAGGRNVKLYKSDDGAVRLVRASSGCAGQISAGNALAPCSMAGIGATARAAGSAQYTPRVISGNGSRVNFTSPIGSSGIAPSTPNTQPGVVSKLFQLDDRGTIATNDDATVQVNMSEKASPDEAQGAIYQTASTDGSRVFFTSSEQLTDVAGSGLYLWERQATDETQSVVVDAAGGTFTVTAHTQPSQGSGTLTNGSTDVTDVVGSFTVGQTIAGPGIDPGTTVVAVDATGGLSLSAPATLDGSQPLAASIDATTDPLPWNATTAQLQAALEGLSMLGTGNVVVSGGPGGSAPYTVEFTGALAGVNVMPLTADASGLSGGARSATISTTHDLRNLTLIADGGGGVLGASEDGHRVYFASGDDILLWQDDGAPGRGISFVARLVAADMQYLTPGPGIFWSFSRQPLSRVTPDGRSLLFEASDGSSLPPAYQHGNCNGNENGSTTGLCSEAYVYRADSSTPSRPDIVCASCNLAVPGVPGDAFLNVRRGNGAALTTSHLGRSLTDDGRRVFFDTTEALVPEDANGAVDVYEYDVPSGQVHLISSGKDPANSYFLDASADGHDVFFVTRAQLVGWDTNQAYDLYDARVDGGFPEPVPSNADCSGDACQGQTPLPAGVVPLGSSVFRGLGDTKPVLHTRATSRKCRRGHVKGRIHGRVRCIRHRHGTRRGARTVRRADR